MKIDLNVSEFRKIVKYRIIANTFKSSKNTLIQNISTNTPLKLGRGFILHIDILKAQMFKNQNGLCDCCQQQMKFSKATSPRYATFEHIKAVSRGGEHLVKNLILTCAECNSTRHTTNYTFFKLMTRLKFYPHVKKFRTWLHSKVRSPVSTIDKFRYTLYARLELLIFSNNVYTAHILKMKQEGKW
jgi:hypothetical protein